MIDEIADAKPEGEGEAPRSSPDVTAPIVVDLGGRRREEIKELKRGEGPLVREVGEAVEHVRAALDDADGADGKILVPVVLVYKKKRKRTTRVTARVIPRS